MHEGLQLLAPQHQCCWSLLPPVKQVAAAAPTCASTLWSGAPGCPAVESQMHAAAATTATLPPSSTRRELRPPVPGCSSACAPVAAAAAAADAAAPASALCGCRTSTMSSLLLLCAGLYSLLSAAGRGSAGCSSDAPRGDGSCACARARRVPEALETRPKPTMSPCAFDKTAIELLWRKELGE
jgi:hypothetical protein